MDTSTSFAGRDATSASNPVQRGVDSAGAALHQGIDKLTDPARSAVDSLSSHAHQTVSSMADSATLVADRFANETRKVTQAPGKAVEYTKTTIQSRPLQAVGLALSLGFIFGRLTAR